MELLSTGIAAPAQSPVQVSGLSLHSWTNARFLRNWGSQQCSLPTPTHRYGL
ncbi:MAG UNVERIFIED_CONTAM: hypothetical protein LVR29_23035 [Microcystis novacekii LVE1205-3]